jgi:RNA polymerase sigma-70 factor, ECF subfamily
MLAEAARRDPAAFSPLYHRYVRQIYRFCYVRLGNQQAAEDATSDIFLRAMGSLHGYRGGSFPAWLFRIAHNVVIDAHRKSRPAVALDQAGNLASADPSPEDQAVARSEAHRLRSNLDRLPEEQRIVIELGLAGWQTAQIADALGKRPGNVRIIRYRAMQRLQTLLDPPDDVFREHQP